jgi:hypothetical protein
MTYGLPDSIVVGTARRIIAHKPAHNKPNYIPDELVFHGALILDEIFYGWIRRLIRRRKPEAYEAPAGFEITAKRARKQQKRFGIE